MINFHFFPEESAGPRREIKSCFLQQKKNSANFIKTTESIISIDQDLCVEGSKKQN